EKKAGPSEGHEVFGNVRKGLYTTASSRRTRARPELCRVFGTTPANESLLYARWHFARYGGVFLAGGFARQHARLAPIGIVTGNCDVKYPLMALFLRLD